MDDLWPDAVEELGYIRKEFLTKATIWLQSVIYKKIAGITVISPEIGTILSRRYTTARGKVHVAEVGVDFNSYEIVNESLKQGDSKRDFLILYTGIFGPAYDFSTVLGVALSLKDDPILFRLHGWGEEEKKIRAEVKRLGLCNVRISTERLDFKSLIQLQREADILLLPMKGQGISRTALPTKLFSYLATGRATVCLAEGAPARLLKEADAGLAVCPGDCRGLRNAILTLQGDPIKIQEFGKNGREFVLRHLDIPNIGKKVEKALFRAMHCHR